jgi:AcrR family transcriptional regulator
MKRPSTKKSENTRANILQCALDLFNERGVGLVTTHDIAHAAGISPGNLYYYFKNKGEITRSIFDQIPMFSAESWKQALAGGDVQFYAFLDFYFSNLSRYRFLFREQMALMRDDELLAKKWSRAHSRLRDVMREAVRHWIGSGIMKKFSSAEEVDAFIDNSWIILSFGNLYFETQRRHEPPAAEDLVIRQLTAFLRPYHTPRGLRVLAKYINCAKQGIAERRL